MNSNQAINSKNNVRETFMTVIVMALVLGSDVALAQASGNVVQNFLDGIIAFLTSGVMRSIAILAVFGMGIAAYLGKCSWDLAMKIGGGVILTFGGASLVDQFSSYV